MTEWELRIQALYVAALSAPGLTTREVLSRADRILKYIQTGDRSG